MTLADISVEEQEIKRKFTKKRKNAKIFYGLGIVIFAFLVIVDICTSTSETPIADGLLIFGILILVATLWHILILFCYRKEEEKALAECASAKRMLEKESRKYAVQDALISLTKEKKQKPRPTNCPNCGALLHGNICDYCGAHIAEA